MTGYEVVDGGGFFLATGVAAPGYAATKALTAWRDASGGGKWRTWWTVEGGRTPDAEGPLSVTERGPSSVVGLESVLAAPFVPSLLETAHEGT